MNDNIMLNDVPKASLRDNSWLTMEKGSPEGTPSAQETGDPEGTPTVQDSGNPEGMTSAQEAGDGSRKTGDGKSRGDAFGAGDGSRIRNVEWYAEGIQSEDE